MLATFVSRNRLPASSAEPKSSSLNPGCIGATTTLMFSSPLLPGGPKAASGSATVLFGLQQKCFEGGYTCCSTGHLTYTTTLNCLLHCCQEVQKLLLVLQPPVLACTKCFDSTCSGAAYHFMATVRRASQSIDQTQQTPPLSQRSILQA